MRLDDEQESSNVEDRRGESGGFGLPGGGGGGLAFGGGRLGCGGIAIVIVVGLVLGVNPLTLLGTAGQLAGPTAQIGQPQTPAPAGLKPRSETDTDYFVRKVLRTTEESWGRIFEGQVGEAYQEPKLVLFENATHSGCGAAESAMGPFYCPADRKVYLDEGFFNDLSRRFGAPGDFAAAYVIAHEVGHHVQNLLGISAKAQEAEQRGSKTQANAISVRVELQADCLAGVWAKDNAQLLELGDVEEAMRAAQAVGDDTLQRAAQGVVVPESFTHGSAAQRAHWFQQGMAAGKISGCDTFAARDLDG